jgi:AsmA protein
MKTVKVALFAAAGIVALVVLALVILVATFDPNKYKPEIAAAVKEKTGRTLAIEGNIGLSLFPDLGVAVGKISLSEPNSSRIFARIDQARVSVALLPLLSRQVVVDRVTLSGLSVDLVKHKDGKTNFADLVAPAGGAAASPRREAPAAGAPRLEIAGIEVRASNVGWHDEASGGRYKVSIGEFRTGRIASGVPGKLSLAARIEATQPKTDLQLGVTSGYRVDLERKTVAFSGLELKISDAASGSSPATTIKGDVEFDLSSQGLRFMLGVDRLNLDRYFPPPAKRGAAGATTASQGSASQAEQPIDLSALKGLKLQGSVKIGELVVSNVKAEKVDVRVLAAGGRIEVKPLSASLYRGSFSGGASVDAGNNHISLKGKLEGVAIGPLLKDALDNDLLEGRGDVALDVQTAGATVAAMKKALSGSATVSLRDGALKGINLGEAMNKARALAGSKSAAEHAGGTGERTDFAEILATFVIKGGIAHNEDLSARSPLLRLSGSGNIDIGANAIDYLAKASLVATSSGQGGTDAAGLRAVTVPVKISGTLDAPRFRADLRAAVGGAVKQRAEEKLKEQVQDRLRGFLRR